MSARFCARCGAPLVRMRVPDEAHERLVCGNCARVSYENPDIVVACIAAAPGAAPVLCCAALAPNETIQAAALRALGSIAIAEDQLALYCMLSDLDAGNVNVVFRAGCAAKLGITSSPSWSAALLQAYAADAARGRCPVRVGMHQGGVLKLDEVPAESVRSA